MRINTDMPARRLAALGARGALSTAFLAGCGGDSPSLRTSTTVLDSADVEIVTSDPAGTGDHCTLGNEPTLSIGAKEGKEGDAPHLFHQVRAAGRLSDGSVAVVDGSSREIRVFGTTGEHLRTMGGPGEGPGEFRGPWLLWVLPGDTLWVGDYLPWRFNVFSPDGVFSRSVTPDDFSLHTLTPPGGVLDDGISVNVTQSLDGTGGGFAAPINYLVIAHGPDEAVLDTIATLPGPRLGSLPRFGGFVQPLFEASSLVAARASTIAMTTTREPEVRLLDGGLRLHRIVRWKDPDRAVTDAHVRAFREDYIAETGGPGSQGWSPGHEARISDDRPVAELFPTASDLMIGRDGRLWLKRYARPRDEPSWMAFAASGDFSCHLRPGVELTPLEFGAGYLLALHRDELGVERVVMYELATPVA